MLWAAYRGNACNAGPRCESVRRNSKRDGGAHTLSPITLEQLIALNREISALAAAGIPLEQGLVRVGQELNGPSSDLASRLASRMDRGEDLGAAIDAEGDAFPKSYRAIVRAGLRSGKLATALEGYSDMATRLAGLRQTVGLATLYPILLLIVMWVLFVFANNFLLKSYDWLNIPAQIWATPFEFLRNQNPTGRWLLTLVPPAILILLSLLWWRRSARVAKVNPNWGANYLTIIPGIGRIHRFGCQANFADLLHLFVKHQLPLPEALPLAADASGLADVSTAAHDLAAELSAGQMLNTTSENFRLLPPLVRIALISNQGPQAVAEGLQRAAENYRQRAENWTQMVSVYFPISLTALIGVTAVIFYAVLLFQPYIATLKEISRSNWE